MPVSLGFGSVRPKLLVLDDGRVLLAGGRRADAVAGRSDGHVVDTPPSARRA